MPSTITIISPVSGETVYVPSGSTLGVTVDYDNTQTFGVFGCCQCTGPSASGGSSHWGEAVSVALQTANEAEIALGPHTANSNGVIISARLMLGENMGIHYAESTVNNITISTTPPGIQIDPPPGPPPTPTPYFYIGAAIEFLDAGGLAVDAKSAKVKKEAKEAKEAELFRRPHRYNRTTDKVIEGVIAAGYREGSIEAVVYGRLGRTGLVPIYTVPQSDIQIVRGTGRWRVKIKQSVLNKLNFPRQLVITLLNKAEEFVSLTSTPLRPE